MYCVYIPHLNILYIYSSVNKHLGSSHYLAIYGHFVYTVLYECIFSFPLVIYLEVEFLSHIWLYVYILEEGPTFSKEAVTFSFSLAVYEGSSFPTSLPVLVVVTVQSLIVFKQPHGL